MGGAAGSGRSAGAALGAGLASHGLLDVVRHEDSTLRERGLLREVALSAAVIVAFGACLGWQSGAMLGAVAGIVPDGEHLLELLSGGRYPAMFPTHIFHSRFHSLLGHPAVSGRHQTALGVGLALVVIALRRRRGSWSLMEGEPAKL
ncbi:MAG TPA: hypothetical protein VKU60_18195 [Chloroflexota bacterium]|nr:hypothetical protein [Chloroflexota bacterium]